MEEADVRKHLLEAKIEMAKDKHWVALREILLMGVTRLVVDKGLIEAKLNFGYSETGKVFPIMMI